jgi:hypothetical protein
LLVGRSLIESSCYFVCWYAFLASVRLFFFIRCFRRFTITLLYLNLNFDNVISIMDYLFLFYLMINSFWSIIWFYCFEDHYILKNYETLWIFIYILFYDIYVLRLSISGVSLWHHSCVAGHGPRIQVVTKVVSEPGFVKTSVTWFS